MIVISDLHCKAEMPFKQATKEFLDWLNKEFPEEKLIFLGDVFDTSSPTWYTYGDFKKFLIKRKPLTYILQGNHDYSKRKGNSLSAYRHIDNVIVIDNFEHTREIDILKILFLPFMYNIEAKERYENLEGKYDFIFTHIMPKQCSFGGEGYSFSKLKGTFFHGHVHMQKDFVDEYDNYHYVLGLPYPTRHGENQDHRIVFVNENTGDFKFINVPFYFKYETIEFGKEPSNKQNILNITHAPSVISVYERYKDYYIREDGIQLLVEESEDEENVKLGIDEDLSKLFITFALNENLDEQLQSTCLKYLQ